MIKIEVSKFFPWVTSNKNHWILRKTYENLIINDKSFTHIGTYFILL